MARKSKAQLKRLQKRAEARGEVYEPPPQQESPREEKLSGENEPKEHPDTDRKRCAAVEELQAQLAAIESNAELKSKDRRSAKRKAEAIAVETSGVASVEELMAWYEEQQQQRSSKRKEKATAPKEQRNPYIVFVGQLSYTTTKEQLFQHIQSELVDHTIDATSIKIRLLTDPKTKQSRGMAFVETQDPETLYALLKLHHTFLDGRRINVERSAGGGKETRGKKVAEFRQEQLEHQKTVVDAMIGEYIKSGEILAGELDEGVHSLCTRHAASVVQAALDEYVEKNGSEMDNPSAYLSFLLGKFAEEGVRDEQERKKQRKDDRPRTDKRSKEPRTGGRELEQQGVDMSISEPTKSDLSSIFPSYSRGRGRG